MAKSTIKTENGRLLPAYPLFVKDPYFSLWSPTDELNGSDTIFWSGRRRRINGLIYCDGATYNFMGLWRGTQKMQQTSLSLTSFTTDYTFTCDAFDLKVSFISPLPLNNLKVLSCPVCYFTYEITPKRKIETLKIGLFLHDESCYDRMNFPIHGGVHYLPQGETAWFGMKKQLFMSHSADDVGAEWGYWYMTGQTAFLTAKSAVDKFIKTGEMAFEWDNPEPIYNGMQQKYLTAFNTHENFDGAVSGMITLAFDDMISIDYYGDWRRGYYFDDGKTTIIDAIADAYENYDTVMAELDAFDEDLRKRTQKYGDDYLLILYAGLRSAISGHKLVKDKNGEILWLSKECCSNGCIATVDVSYPSVPLFLLYNPELVKGMLRPIFEFSKMPVWENDYAPHDAGTYPHCMGQIYGAKARNKDMGKDKIDHRNYTPYASKDQLEAPYTYPPIYLFPKGSDEYLFQGQMPVEESGNMLIMVAGALVADGDKSLAKKNFITLTKWVKYLVKYGLEPGNQLSTDDFAGHLDKNINLSVKAIVGIRAFAYICEQLGKGILAKKYYDIAYNYAKEWKKMCVKEGKQIPIAFDGDENAYSLKYNMAFDVLFGTGLFDEEVREREVDHYIKVADRYGTSLDSREKFGKSDWIVWSAVLSSDTEKRKKMIAPLVKYLKETTSRYAFPDCYYTDDGVMLGGINKYGYHLSAKNRTVQGGLFMLLLDDSGKMKI